MIVLVGEILELHRQYVNILCLRRRTQGGRYDLGVTEKLISLFGRQRGHELNDVLWLKLNAKAELSRTTVNLRCGWKHFHRLDNDCEL